MRTAVARRVGFEVRLEDGDELRLGDSARPVIMRVSLQHARRAGPRELALVLPDATQGLEALPAGTVGSIPNGFDREALLALHRLATRLSVHLDVDELLAAFVDCVLDAFPRANHVSVYLADDEGGFHAPTISRGRSGDTGVRPVSRTLRDQVVSGGQAIVFSDTDAAFDGSESLHESNVRAGLCAPLWNGKTIAGLVQVDRRGAGPGAFEKRDLEVLVVFAHQAALAIENARLHLEVRTSCEQSIRGLVRALEAKDEYTSGHSEEVAALCHQVATFLGLPREEAERVRRAALLHDIGKIGIPHSVLNKKGALTPEEFRLLRTHPELGARILEPLAFLSELVPIVLHHHERFDGRGYPGGLSGEAIPLGARVLAVVDTYHALVSDRAYRAGIGREIALEELHRCAGTQFDPAVVEALSDVLSATPAPEDAPVAEEPELVGV